MSGPVTLDSLDLAALLCSRVCHDLISPAGAIVNGLEVLEEGGDAETKTFAMDLIKKSARTASARLQFCRIAFGAAGSAGAQIDTGDAENVARGFIEDDKVKLTWNLPRALLPKNRVKLLLNMLVVAGGTIPRGGTLDRRSDRVRRDRRLQDHRHRHQCAHPPGGAGPARGPGRERNRGCPRHPAVLYRPLGQGLRAFGRPCRRRRHRDGRHPLVRRSRDRNR